MRCVISRIEVGVGKKMTAGNQFHVLRGVNLRWLSLKGRMGESSHEAQEL
jgi:hypothetical protein